MAAATSAAVIRRKMAALPALGWWLVCHGAIRLALAWLGFFASGDSIRAGIYSHTHVSDVHARTFGVLALLASTLCFLCAFDLDNEPLFVATLLTTVYAYAHFVVEHLVYGTVSAANLGKLGVVAVTTVVWMTVHLFRRRGNDAPSRRCPPKRR